MENNDETEEPELTEYERGRKDGIKSALEDARYHITGHVATAEKWRYDRVVRDFGILLGEIDASILDTWDGADYLRPYQINPSSLKIGDVYASYNPEKRQFLSELRLFEGDLSEEEKNNSHIEYFLRWHNNPSQ